ncbi:hypothetical protein HK405_013467, partial [Cladochytrium tenue]
MSPPPAAAADIPAVAATFPAKQAVAAGLAAGNRVLLIGSPACPPADLQHAHATATTAVGPAGAVDFEMLDRIADGT